uniref:Aminotransferase class I/classII large domain-containing protein n=1 Tax=Alexandrium monilatum TaxID=311494 RepID=A0A7S4SW16_9DINO
MSPCAGRAAEGPGAVRSASSVLLDMAKGHPDPALLPREALAEACAHAATDFSSGSARGLPYGSQPRGSTAFLAELAAFIERQCPAEVAARADGLLLTNGVSHGLELVCSVFSQPGEAVLVEAPSYWLALGIFQSRGLEVVPVPTDAEGLLVGAAEDILNRRPEGSPRARFLYTVPTSHNPTGSSLPAERRRALVDMARRWGLLVLADEVYHLLDWHAPQKRPPRMVFFDEAYSTNPVQPIDGAENDDPAYGDAAASPGQFLSHPDSGDVESLEPAVISVSSFTKILAPGLRVGWIEAAPVIIESLSSTGYLRSGGCVATFAADAILGHVLKSRDADAVLASLVAEYRSRAKRLVAALEDVGLPPLVQPQGGYFLWVPMGVDSREVLEIAKAKHAVTFMPGTSYDAPGSSELAQCARLCFARLSSEELEEGVRRLAKAVSEVAQRSQAPHMTSPG